jgi:hypothetical protein
MNSASGEFVHTVGEVARTGSYTANAGNLPTQNLHKIHRRKRAVG